MEFERSQSRHLFDVLPQSHQEVVATYEEYYDAKVGLLGSEGDVVLQQLGTFGGLIPNLASGTHSAALTSALQIPGIALIGEKPPLDEVKLLGSRLDKTIRYTAATNAHSLIRNLSEVSGQPLHVVRDNLDNVEWNSVTKSFVDGFSNKELREAALPDVDEVRGLPLTDRAVGVFMLRTGVECGITATTLATTALLSGNKKTILKTRNAIYGVAQGTPEVDMVATPNSVGHTITFYDQHRNEIHIADYARHALQKDLYQEIVRYIDDVAASKASLAAFQTRHQALLQLANQEHVWRAFSVGPDGTMTADNLREFYPDIYENHSQPRTIDDTPPPEFGVTEWLEGPLFPAATGQGTTQEVSSQKDEEALAPQTSSVPSAYVDFERNAMLERIKGWTKGTKGIRSIFKGEGMRRFRAPNGEVFSEEYLGVVLPIYDKNDEVVSHFLAAESLIAGRNVTIVYRSDVGELPWEQIVNMPKNEVGKIKGVRFLTHTTVGSRSATETTEEKLMYLFTCTPEEYQKAQFGGETAKGELKIRGLGRTALSKELDESL